jgi:alpha-beta hydrolase superfamily lysophospholipase
MKSLINRVLIGLSIGALLLAGFAWILGSKLVAPANHQVPLPADFQAQVVSIPGPGHLIAGWWVDQRVDSPVILLLHAVRSDRSSMVSRAELFMRHGFSVLLIDLQAHGETPGDVITLGVRESSDVTAARDWIRRTRPGRRVGVVGCSLGGAAILLSSQPSGFDAVVLEAVYPRISRAVENRIRIRLGPLAPILAPLLLMQLEPRLHIAASDLEPIRSIGRLGSPVLVVAGSKDKHTTLAESQALYDAASSPKSLWIVEGARHEDFLAYDSLGYDAHVAEFLIETLAAHNGNNIGSLMAVCAHSCGSN